MEITATLVKELRDRSGVGMMECKKALVETGGNLDKAFDHLRKAGAAKALKKEGREAKEGIVLSYIHPGAKLGVLLELNCETDFVAKTEDFTNLGNDIAMHIAATDPLAASVEDIAPEIVEKEKEIYSEQAKKTNKPAEIIEKMVEGRLKKFYKENVLIEQDFVKDPNKTIKDIITDTVGKLGENIVISRFKRFQLGEKN
ncbi:MAG: translation elongation factor Ts [Candidatus Marinimicrobia bacterium]|nr:translation elongation factor Ts [Candidatus Neomarinimicrobiota bacterium]|tara:strand:+ start:416 stop:1015 length:600 start_codon:yes stop_codon:yes gene_type:complete